MASQPPPPPTLWPACQPTSSSTSSQPASSQQASQPPPPPILWPAWASQPPPPPTLTPAWASQPPSSSSTQPASHPPPPPTLSPAWASQPASSTSTSTSTQPASHPPPPPAHSRAASSQPAGNSSSTQLASQPPPPAHSLAAASQPAGGPTLAPPRQQHTTPTAELRRAAATPVGVRQICLASDAGRRLTPTGRDHRITRCVRGLTHPALAQMATIENVSCGNEIVRERLSESVCEPLNLSISPLIPSAPVTPAPFILPSTSYVLPSASVPPTPFILPSTSSVPPASFVRPLCSVPDPYADELRRVERNRQAIRRSRETPSQTASRNAACRELRARNLANESTEERSNRLSLLSQRRSQERAAAVLQAGIDRFLNSQLTGLGFAYQPELPYSSHPSLDIGSMNIVCTHCGARKFLGETLGMCCSSGKVHVELIEQPPEPILSLFSGATERFRKFLRNISKYNSCFQMTSFGVKGGFNSEWSTFCCQGQIYHQIGSLVPTSGATPSFLQIYFMGGEDLQIDRRTNVITGLDRSIVGNFQELLNTNNRLIRSFKTLLERQPTESHRIVIRADKTPAGQHPGRFNQPRADEVAILLVDNQCSPRDVVLHCKGDQSLRNIDECHRSYDALQYPLIFWKGQDSYNIYMKQTDPNTRALTHKNLSSADYYSYLLMIRDDHQNFVLKCRRLLSQFVVDMFAKVESERLRFIRANQAQLRAEEYVHLRDAVANDGDGADIGQRVILPSSFIGGPRHMHEYTQDAMAYVRLYGRPCLFLTFTCNPRWPEIQNLLMPHQTHNDRHDIIARVFNQKLLKLMDVLTKQQHFGRARCYMYTIEWQKRGLPHAHILLWLREKLRPEQIDSVISAEIPDKNLDPLLFDIVTRNMIHGPCGHLNRNNSCMENGKCTKDFPKPFRAETESGVNGYPLYRRRKPDDGGQFFVTKFNNQDVIVDNTVVIPYCPSLSRMFDAHLNVESCHSVESIKYICKYINKGSDMAVIEHQTERNDEVTQYQVGRYISTNEAFWRIFKFKIHNRDPGIVHLDVHLKNGQRVVFRPENVAALARDAPRTTLTEFFSLCQTDSFARGLLYVEVPTYYIWGARKTWSKRRRGTPVAGWDGRASDVVARMYTVHPNNQECFYMRMLLHRVRGPTSFEDLRRFEGRVCSTYREACQLRGMLESDSHWKNALSEAAASRMPSQLRILFAMIVSLCSPTDPLRLWEQFKKDLSEDILLQQRRENRALDLDYTDSIFNQALILIEDICLSMAGKPLNELGLFAPNRAALDPFNGEILRETSYNVQDLQTFVAANLPHLVSDQKAAFDAIVSAIDLGEGGLFFLDAPGGTGKTYLINLILAQIRQHSQVVLAVASSGIAATLLSGGRTAHSALKLPFNITNSDAPVCSISKQSAKARMSRSCKAIIWDECTMSHKKSLEAVDRTLRDLRDDDSLFGGIVVVLAGDFRQTLPVMKGCTPADEINACLKNSVLWTYVAKLTLSTNMRVHLHGDIGVEAFAQQLLSIGNGLMPPDPSSGMITLPTSLCSLVSNKDELIDRVFFNLQSNLSNKEWLCERAILAPKNDDVDELNFSIQERIQGRNSRTYLSIDTVVDPDQAVNYPIEFLNSLSVPGLPAHALTLKIGSPIMLLRNLAPPRLCNGTRLCVKSLHNHVIEATILNGTYKGDNVFIPRIPMIPTDLVCEFKRLQFPVRLAFAITINKSQGQSLKVVGIDLSLSCFSHGQLYVACSRVGNPKNMYVLAHEGMTRNVVYPQALA